ncbi:hypothetical protein TKK_0017402 [Trichogramma kaykai]
MATAKSTFINFGFAKICEKYRSNLKEHTHKPLELLNDYQDFDKKIRKMNMELLSLNSKTMKLPVFSSPQTSDKKLKTLHKCKKICNSKHQMRAQNQLWLFKKVMSLYEKFHQIIEQSCSEYHALREMSESYKFLFNREKKVKSIEESNYNCQNIYKMFQIQLDKMPNDLTIHSEKEKLVIKNFKFEPERVSVNTDEFMTALLMYISKNYMILDYVNIISETLGINDNPLLGQDINILWKENLKRENKPLILEIEEKTDIANHVSLYKQEIIILLEEILQRVIETLTFEIKKTNEIQEYRSKNVNPHLNSFLMESVDFPIKMSTDHGFEIFQESGNGSCKMLTRIAKPTVPHMWENNFNPLTLSNENNFIFLNFCQQPFVKFDVSGIDICRVDHFNLEACFNDLFHEFSKNKNGQDINYPKLSLEYDTENSSQKKITNYNLRLRPNWTKVRRKWVKKSGKLSKLSSSGIIENISIGVGEFSIRRKDMGSQADFPMIELSDNSTSYSDAENERETDFQRTLEHLHSIIL